MKISVVICAYTMERWDSLVAAIDSCVAQSLTPAEVIVVIDYNEALFARASKELGSARVVANSLSKGLSGARNSGVVASSGDLIVFLDDDAYAESEWLKVMSVALADPSVAGVGGWVLPDWQGPLPRWLPQTFYWVLGCSYEGLPLTSATIRNPIGASMALRRRVFSTVGGFTSGIGRIGQVPLGCEETELCIRYTQRRTNERFVLARDAIVHHRVPQSRLTWHYFWTRCWAEGLSKAAVSSLVGKSSGLASERAYVMRALPREIVTSVRALRSQPKTSATRIALIFSGTTCAVAGMLWGTLALRRKPLEPVAEELALLKPVVEEED